MLLKERLLSSKLTANALLLLAITSMVNLCNCNVCSVTTEYCFYNKPSVTLMPQQNEFGVYLTRKSECALLRRDAATYPIPVTGDPEVGEVKLPHTHRILYNEPYAAQKATVYHVACPQGHLAYFRLLSMDFEPDSCSDYLEVEMSTGNRTLCGCDTTATTTPIIGQISRLLFRSDNRNVNGRTGFTAFLQCFNPQDANLAQCSSGSDDILEMLVRRRRRRNANQTNYLPSGEAKTVLHSLSTAMFEVVAKNLNRQTPALDNTTTARANFSDQDIEVAICHMRSCNAVLRATARAILNHTAQFQSGRVEDIYRSKFTPPSPPPIVEPPILKDRCENTSLISTCSEIGYSRSYFPNFRLLESVEDTNREINDFNPLIASACSNAIAHLLCSVYAPMCYTDEQGNPAGLYPCVELCLHVRSDCEGIMESFGLNWPHHLDCENTDIYKPRNSSDNIVYCPDDIDAVQIPSNLLPDVPTNDPVLVVFTQDPDTGGERSCESTSVIPVCANIGYTSALFPNTRHQTPFGANNDLQNLQPLFDSNCSVFLSHLLCSVNAPFCYEDQSGTAVGLQTCSELCYVVKSTCEPVLHQHNLRWPSYLDCNNGDVFRPNDTLTYCPSDLNISGQHQPSQATPTVVTPVTSTMPVIQPELPELPSGSRSNLYTCSNMTDISICSPLSSLGWTSTSFPNFRNHRTHKEAEDELSDYQELINMGCSNTLVHFLCSVYAPYCDLDYPQIRLRPCKELCLHVRDGCEDNLLSFGIPWPEHFNCNNATLFPPRSSGVINFCPDGIETLHLPSN